MWLALPSSLLIPTPLLFLQEVNSPIMIQFSNGGGAAIAGKGISNKGEQASIAGSSAVR